MALDEFREQVRRLGVRACDKWSEIGMYLTAGMVESDWEGFKQEQGRWRRGYGRIARQRQKNRQRPASKRKAK